MTNLWKVIIAVIVTLVVIGGGTYYYMNGKAVKERNDLQAQIDGLNQQVSDLSAASEVATTGTVATTGATATTGTPSTSTGTNTSGSCASSSKYSYDIFKNGYIANPDSGNVSNIKLTNGVYTKGATTITLVSGFVACDTSGNNDAAIILKYNDGGTGYIYYVETFAPYSGSYAPTAWSQLGDRIVMQTLSMANDVVTVNYLSQGPNDSAATPTQKTTSVYKVPTSGTALIKQ